MSFHQKCETEHLNTEDDREEECHASEPSKTSLLLVVEGVFHQEAPECHSSESGDADYADDDDVDYAAEICVLQPDLVVSSRQCGRQRDLRR